MDDTTVSAQQPDSAADAVAVEDDNNKKRSLNAKILTVKITAVFSTCVQASIIILLLCGAVQYYRHDLNIVYAVKLLIDLISISRATIYRTLFGVIIAIMYIVVLSFMIKWFVASLKRCIYTVAKKDGNAAELLGATNIIFDYCFIVLRFFLGLMTVSGLFSPCAISGAAIAVMVLVGVVYVVSDVLFVILDDQVRSKAAPVILKVSKDIVIYAALCAVIAIINTTAVKDLIYGLQKMFNGNIFSKEGGSEALVYALYIDIVEPSLFIAVAIIVLLVFDEILQPSRAFHAQTKGRLITVIVLTCVLMACQLFIRLLTISGDSFDSHTIGVWLSAVSSTYLPLLLLAITFLLSITCLCAPQARVKIK